MGGAETVLFRLLDAADGESFDPVVLSMKDRGALGEALERRGVPVLTLGMKRQMPSPVAVGRLLRHLRAVRPDLLVGWMYHGNLVADLARAVLGIRVPMVWNVRHTPTGLEAESRVTRWAIRIGARRARRAWAVVYNSSASAQRHRALGFPEENAVVLPNGFDCRRFRPSPEARPALRRSLGLADDAVLVGRIGRFHAQKDYATFLDATGRLARERPALYFVLAGPGIDRDNSTLRRWIDEAGLASRVHLLGPVDRMPELLAGLDLSCSSSSFGESFPNVVAESMACGVPCAVTDVGDSAALVGATGRVVPPGDPAALARALGELLDLRPEEREALGRQARRRIEERFSAQAVFPRYERIWLQALAGSDGPAAEPRS